MRLVMPAHLLWMTWLLLLQANWRNVGAQTVCPHNETSCNVNADRARVYLMICTGYGALTQLPPACTETRLISNLIIGRGTAVNTLQHRILDGLQMRQLELTGLGIQSITESAFEAISSYLQVLHLQDNQLERLQPGIFSTLLSLSRLQLHNNRLTQLSYGIFAGLTNLVYLTLNVNQIAAVDPSTWYALPRLVTLALEYNRLGDGRLLFPDRAMDHLEELRLDRNRLGAINDNIISGLPNLRRLSFRENGVQSLPNNAFRAVPRLEVVDLSTNNISQLTRASLNGLTSLTTLVLDENLIRLLPDSLFLDLKNLQILSLRGNKISDVYSNSFIGLVGLLKLDLSRNNIPVLPLGIFDPLGLLQTLSVASNEIRHVEQKPFQSCRNLLSFNMANNLLSSIGAELFVPTTRLTFLRLANNRIEKIHSGAFNQLRQLKELDLSENYLSDLRSDSFINCRSMQKLNLSHNPVRQLASPGTTFSGLTALKQLDLTGCCITKLVLNSSTPLPALTELYLGNNLLTEVSRYSLAATTNLQRLDLGDNSIAALDAGALSSLTSLNWLNLSRNLLTEDQVAAAIRSAPSDVIVDVSRNRVESLALLSSPLRGIYLSGNPLVCSCTSPFWISLADTSRFPDAITTLCYSGSEPVYLLCYWSRCGPSTDHQLCNVSIPSNVNSSLVSLPSKTCELSAALMVFGPRFIHFDAQALSPTSAHLSWNITDEFITVAGFQLTLTVVDNCTDASEDVFSSTGNETSYSICNDDINSTTIDIGNLTSRALYIACAQVLQAPTGNSNRTSVSDTRCTCLDLATKLNHRLTVDLRIWATSNRTAIFVQWNSTEHVTCFWLTCFNGEDQQFASAKIQVQRYVIGNLSHSTTYNVCVTAVANQDHMDLTRCVVIKTDDPPRGNAVRPTEHLGLFLPVACLLLLLVIVCITVLVICRRRRQKKPSDAETTSSSTCDSSTGNCGQKPGRTSILLSEQSVTMMKMYAELAPSAPPLQGRTEHMYSNTTVDPLPTQSSFNIYDPTLSY